MVGDACHKKLKQKVVDCRMKVVNRRLMKPCADDDQKVDVCRVSCLEG